MWTSRDRWTCPQCQTTTVIDGSDHDTAAAIDAVRTRHYQAHRDAAAVAAKLDQSAQRKGAA
jgi:hypothetical protein